MNLVREYLKRTFSLIFVALALIIFLVGLFLGTHASILSKKGIDTKTEVRKSELDSIYDKLDNKAFEEYAEAQEKYDECLKTITDEKRWNTVSVCGFGPIFGYKPSIRQYDQDAEYAALSAVRDTSLPWLILKNIGLGWLGPLMLAIVLVINCLRDAVGLVMKTARKAVAKIPEMTKRMRADFGDMSPFQRYIILILIIFLVLYLI